MQKTNPSNYFIKTILSDYLPRNILANEIPQKKRSSLDHPNFHPRLPPSLLFTLQTRRRARVHARSLYPRFRSLSK